MTAVVTDLAASAPQFSEAPPRRRVSVNRIVGSLIVLGLLAFGVYSFMQMDLRWQVIETASGKVHKVFATMGPISFPSVSDSVYLIELTLGVVILGTFIAALISVPVAYLAASNTSPGRIVSYIGRAIGVVTRAVPDVIIALAVSLTFELGSTIPGIIAFGIHSVGMISKLFADAIEQIDEGPRTAIRAAGGSKGQQFWAGVFPQVLPSWVATTLHRFDINLRGSVILGYAGVGGLGYRMRNEFEAFHFGAGLGIAIIVFVMCVILEMVSSTIRRNLLGVQPAGRSLGETIVRRLTKGRTTASSADPVPVVATIEGSLHRPWTRERIRNTVWVWIGIALVIASYFAARVRFDQVLWNYVWPSIKSYWPPSYGTYGAEQFWDALKVTVEIAFAASIITLVFSLVFGSLAARNVAPNSFLRNLFRVVLTLIRGVPELVLAIFLIAATGLGNQPGLIALAFGGIGLLGKLIADSFEEVPRGPEQALRAAGGSRSQVYFAATLPQGLPSLIGNSLYLVDTNLRAASILGIVGAGGVGFYLTNASASLRLHGEVTTLVFMVFFVVLLVEALATYLRRVFK